jgi:hypothetical protein
VFGATATIPVAVFTVIPAGSVPVVIVTFPGAVPITTARPRYTAKEGA